MKKNWFFSLVGFVAACGAASTASAQTTGPTPDVLAPRADYGDTTGRPDIPTLRSDILQNFPAIQFIFDTALDPQQVSTLLTLTQADMNDPRLSEGARSVIRNHMAALQQVELAIRFLQANRSQIIAGRDAGFNSVFGNISQLRNVAVISPNPLGGLATLARPAVNNNNTNGSQYYQLTFQAQGGGNNNNATLPSIASQVRAGDFVYVVPSNGTGQAAGNTAGTTGFISRIFLVASGSAQGGGNNNGQERIILDPAYVPRLTANAQLNNLLVYRVVRTDVQSDSSRFNDVLATFQAIRDTLEGIVPPTTQLGAAQAQLLNSPITYNRSFTDINTIWGAGVAPYTALNGTVQRFVQDRAVTLTNGNTGTPTIFTADRLTRQFGFSTSDSFSHLDRLEDQAAGRQSIGRNGQTTYPYPLLWSDDNALPLQFDTRQRVTGSTDEDRAFFRDRQTIFGGPDNVFTQYLGRAFFDETINHAGSGTLDDTVRIDDTLQQALRQQRIPAGGVPQTFNQTVNGVVSSVPQTETANVPESGTPTKKDTEFRRWQMIIESFAEHASDLTQFNTAAIGLREMLGGGVLPSDLAVKDAGNYARFANVIGGSGTDSIDFDKVEPFGKRADGGFNPVVPIQ